MDRLINSNTRPARHKNLTSGCNSKVGRQPGRRLPLRLSLCVKSAHKGCFCRALLAIIILSVFNAPVCLANPQSENEVDQEMKQALKAALSSTESFSDKFEAEVWLLQKATVLKKFVKDDNKRLHILKEVHKAATHAGLPSEFVLAVIEVESHFDRYAVSVAGAQGMMQVMPFWKKVIGRESDSLIDLQTNLRYGCAILKYYLDKEKGHWAPALARYNGSYGKFWYPEKVMDAWQKHWR